MPIMDKKNSEWFNEIEEPIEDEFDDFDDDEVDYGKSEYEDDFGIDARTGLSFGTHYDPDEPDWDAMERELDIDDNEYSDEELANIYGGDLTYCPECGKRLAMDDGYSYCPDCEPKRIDENSNFDDWVRYDKEGTIVSTNADGYTLLKMDDAGLNSDVFHWIVKDSSGKIIFDTGRLRYGSSISWTSRKERHWTGAYVYGDAVILKCIANKYGFSDQDILNHIDSEMQDRYRSAMGKSEYKHLNWSDAVIDAESSNVIDNYIVKDTLLEAPMIKLSDDQLNNPSDINFSRIIKDTEEKERAEKEEAERLARKAELSRKYSNVTYKIQKVNDTSEPGIEINRLEAAFDELVPTSGKADSVAGEIVRATMRILYRYYNDGDYFFMGYGLETAAPAATYLADRYEDIIDEALDIGKRFADEYGTNTEKFDEKYEEFLRTLADTVVTDIIENPELMEEENDEDFLEYDPDYIISEQPRFETDFMLSQDAQDLFEADIVSVRDIQYYVEGCFEWESIYEGCEISYEGGDYVYISNLKYDGFEAIKDMFTGYNSVERFWEDFVNDYADELEAYRNGEDEDYEDEETEFDDEGEDYSESYDKELTNVKLSPKNTHTLKESLSSRLVTGDLDYNSDTDSFVGDSGDIQIDLQDRETHTHQMRGPKRWASPKVKTHSWGRIWKDGNVEHFYGSKNEVRSRMAKRLRSMGESFSESSNSYKLDTADEIMGTMIGNLDDAQIDSMVRICERVARKLGVSKMSDLYVLTIDDEYSPDWTMATREGKPQNIGKHSIQYWTLNGNLFAELRINGQSMLFFGNETDALSYVDSVDAENLNESLNDFKASCDLHPGDEFVFAEIVPYDANIDNFIDCVDELEHLRTLPIREQKKKLVQMGFKCPGEGVLIMPGTKGKLISKSPYGLEIFVNGVTLDFGGDDFAVKMSNGTNESLREGYHSNSEEYAPYFPEEYKLYDEQTANIYIQTTNVFLNDKKIGTIQKHPKMGGGGRRDYNKVLSTYYVVIPSGGQQEVVDTPEEAVKVILGKSDSIKESAYNKDVLKRFQDSQRIG